MEKSTSSDELTVRNQFDRICKMALKSEVTDYIRHLVYRQRYEILFSEMSKRSWISFLLWMNTMQKVIAFKCLVMTLK